MITRIFSSVDEAPLSMINIKDQKGLMKFAAETSPNYYVLKTSNDDIVIPQVTSLNRMPVNLPSISAGRLVKTITGTFLWTEKRIFLLKKERKHVFSIDRQVCGNPKTLFATPRFRAWLCGLPATENLVDLVNTEEGLSYKDEYYRLFGDGRNLTVGEAWNEML